MQFHKLLTSALTQVQPGAIKIIQDLGFEQMIFRDEFMK